MFKLVLVLLWLFSMGMATAVMFFNYVPPDKIVNLFAFLAIAGMCASQLKSEIAKEKSP